VSGHTVVGGGPVDRIRENPQTARAVPQVAAGSAWNVRKVTLRSRGGTVIDRRRAAAYSASGTEIRDRIPEGHGKDGNGSVCRWAPTRGAVLARRPTLEGGRGDPGDRRADGRRPFRRVHAPDAAGGRRALLGQRRLLDHHHHVHARLRGHHLHLGPRAPVLAVGPAQRRRLHAGAAAVLRHPVRGHPLAGSPPRRAHAAEGAPGRPGPRAAGGLRCGHPGLRRAGPALRGARRDRPGGCRRSRW